MRQTVFYINRLHKFLWVTPYFAFNQDNEYSNKIFRGYKLYKVYIHGG